MTAVWCIFISFSRDEPCRWLRSLDQLTSVSSSNERTRHGTPGSAEPCQLLETCFYRALCINGPMCAGQRGYKTRFNSENLSKVTDYFSICIAIIWQQLHGVQNHAWRNSNLYEAPIHGYRLNNQRFTIDHSWIFGKIEIQRLAPLGSFSCRYTT